MIENVSTQLTVFHCFAHCLLPGRAFASLYALLFLEKEAEIGGRDVFEWDMGHWPILRAHHHFGLGLTLQVCAEKLIFFVQPKHMLWVLNKTVFSTPKTYVKIDG